MSHKTSTVALAIAGAFATGIVVSPIMHGMSDAFAQTPSSVAAVMLDLASMKHGDIPTTPNSEMNTKMLVSTDNATIQIQSGNVAKHSHPKTDEIQYIIEGSGAMWLGSERKDFKPGTLIIIPKGTAHGGTIVASGPVKALAIKIPPQARDDVVFLN